MCVFFLSLQPSSPFVLVATNNRDEFFARKTARAAFWDNHPKILAGIYNIIRIYVVVPFRLRRLSE